jgi:hypothetical protein
MTTRFDKDVDRIGRKARAALEKPSKSRDWHDWMQIGEALVVGREVAMREVGVNAPMGRGYNEAFGKWLRQYGLHKKIDKSDRARLFTVMEHRGEIEEFRSSLPLAKRLRLNHPSTVLRHWRRR